MDHLKPTHVKNSATIDVTATNDILLPPSLAVPTPPVTTRTTLSGRHVHRRTLDERTRSLGGIMRWRSSMLY